MSSVNKGTGTLSGHEDERRRIVDVLCDPQVPLRHSILTVKESIPVGNHYHDCREVFVLERGCITRLILEDAKSGERWEFKDLPPGTRIEIAPCTAHALVMEHGSVLHMYVFSDVPPTDKDLYKPYHLL